MPHDHHEDLAQKGHDHQSGERSDLRHGRHGHGDHDGRHGRHRVGHPGDGRHRRHRPHGRHGHFHPAGEAAATPRVLQDGADRRLEDASADTARVTRSFGPDDCPKRGGAGDCDRECRSCAYGRRG